MEKCGGRVGVVREEWCLYFILYIYIYTILYYIGVGAGC